MLATFRCYLVIGVCLRFLVWPHPVAAAVPAENPIDVRLVIDVSGSMKLNDPSNLRKPAVELLLELLPDQSRAGIWIFGRWVNMITPHASVDANWRLSARENANKINSAGLFTNIGEALEKAAYDRASTDPNTRKHIIVLTDGMVDIDKQTAKNQREWRRIVDDVIPQLKTAGYVVHTIALSDNADLDLLNKIAVATDGVAGLAKSADDLMKIFLKAFDAAVPTEQVPLSGNRFLIDASVDEFTALIFRARASAELELQTPDKLNWNKNSANSAVRWHHTDRYDLITVQTPQAGEWAVVGDIDPDSRVTVLSNLNVRVRALTKSSLNHGELPNNVLKGAQFDLELGLYEDGQLVGDDDFLNLLQVEMSLLGGNSFDALVSLWRATLTPEPGAKARYRAQLPAMTREGVYEIRAVVDGQTFNRKFVHPIVLREAFSADLREKNDDGIQRFILTVNAFEPDIDYNRSQIIAAIIKPDQERVVEPLKISDLDKWELQIVPDMPGEYRMDVMVKGVSTLGKHFRYDLEPQQFHYSSTGEVAPKSPTFSEPEPTPTVVATPSPLPSEAPAPVEEAVPEKPNEKMPSWILYAALALGNLIIILLGYVIFRKIMGKPDKALDDIITSDNETGEAPVPASAKPPAVEEEEEEPPMEDLDPDTPSQSTTNQLGAHELFDTPSSDDEVLSETPFGKDSGAFDTDYGDDDIDDLDAMAMDIARESEQAQTQSEEDSDEEDDIVAAMMKAQGLDLAEDELDDAISSLIDDLDDLDDDEPRGG